LSHFIRILETDTKYTKKAMSLLRNYRWEAPKIGRQ